MNIEQGLIYKLLETKDYNTIENEQITPILFNGENKQVFDYILKTYRETGEIISKEGVEYMFPNYTLEKPSNDDTLQYWCVTLRQREKHNLLADAVEQASKHLEKLDADEALQCLKKTVTTIEMDIDKKNCVDITEDIDTRINDYYARKSTQGMRGVPYGIPALDFYTKGLKKETLTTVTAKPGVGKALAWNTKVMTPDGYCNIGDLIVGDKVFGSDGFAHNVTGIYYQGEKQIVKLKVDNNDTFRCCKDHLWIYKVGKHGTFKVDTAEQMIKDSENNTLYLKGCKPLQYTPEQALPVDPYVLGILITSAIYTEEYGIVFYNKSVSDIELYFREVGKLTTDGEGNYRLTEYGDLVDRLVELDIFNEDARRIPNQYLRAKVTDRWALLQGIIDGCDTGDAMKFIVNHPSLARTISLLLRSLGLQCFGYNEVRSTGENVSIVCILKETLAIRDIPEDEEQVCSLQSVYSESLKITFIHELETSEEMYCISVDSPDKSYVLAGAIVTHNTWFEVLIGSYNQLQNRTVLQLVTEMPTASMRDRYEAMLYSMCYGGINYEQIRSGTLPKDKEKMFIDFLKEGLADLPALYVSTVSGVLSVRESINRYKPDIVLIDGAYLMDDDNGSDSDWLRITHITRDLKKLAKSAKVPILINTQTDKKADKMHGAELSDISYSQSYGMDSDDVLVLHRDEEMLASKEMQIKIVKQREGILGKVQLHWDFQEMDFTQIFSETEENEDEPVNVEWGTN